VALARKMREQLGEERSPAAVRAVLREPAGELNK
jgi:hypothetical protein